MIDEHNAKVAEETAEIDKKIKELEESETESSESDTPETESPDSDTPEAEAADADKKEQEVAKLKQQRDELNKTLRSYGKIQAPKFQRDFKWTPKNHIALFGLLIKNNKVWFINL